MKKFTFTFVFFMVVCLCNAQIINFPDPNFKARLLAASPGLQIASGTASIPGTPFVKIDTNNDGEIQVSEALAVTNLWLYNANITSLAGIENFTNVTQLNVYGNNIPNLDLSVMPQLTRINISGNHIVNLNVNGLSNAEWLNCLFNDITSLDLMGMTTMTFVQCQNNQLTYLNISNATNLHTIYCQNNLLTNLDVSNVGGLVNLDCFSNNLRQLSVKNNSDEVNLDFSNNPNLQYVCADSSELPSVQSKINQYGYTTCFANSFCSFNPGNPVYFVEGSVKYDELNDGCDNGDIAYPNLTFLLSDGTNSGNVYSDSDGEFNTASQSTSITITPQLVNPAYFSVSPSSQTLALTDSTTALTQNFCVTPNGSHPDLEITLSGGSNGFEANNYYYTLTYRNKGTQTQSGDLSLSFNDVQQNFVTSTPAASAATNLLTWNFTDLKPFETRTIQIQFYMNFDGSGTVLQQGDILSYVGTISSSLTEETPIDNTFTLNLFYSSVVLSNPNPLFSTYFALYPNPTHDILNIKTKSDVLIEGIAVYNLLGQSVYQTKDISGDAVINVSDLANGAYIIKIFSDKGIYNSRFIKK